jgi:hypothetical protein
MIIERQKKKEFSVNLIPNSTRKFNKKKKDTQIKPTVLLQTSKDHKGLYIDL